MNIQFLNILKYIQRVELQLVRILDHSTILLLIISKKPRRFGSKNQIFKKHFQGSGSKTLA